MACGICGKYVLYKNLESHQKSNKICIKKREETQSIQQFEKFFQLPLDIQRYILSNIERCVLRDLYKTPHNSIRKVIREIFEDDMRKNGINTKENKSLLFYIKYYDKRLTQSKMISYYKVSMKSLKQNFDYLEAENPHYKNSYPIKLFSYIDLLRYLINTHGSMEKFLLWKKEKASN